MKNWERAIKKARKALEQRPAHLAGISEEDYRTLVRDNRWNYRRFCAFQIELPRTMHTAPFHRLSF